MSKPKRLRFPITLARVQQKLAQDGKARLLLPAVVENGESRVTLVCLDPVCEHKHETSAHSIIASQYGCRRCHARRLGESQRIDPERALALCEVRNYRRPVLDYKDGSLHITFECPFGREHRQVWYSFQRQGQGCGCATKVSSYEHLVQQLVEHVTGRLWPKVHGVQLRKLFAPYEDGEPVPREFDLFCEALGVAIEVDGEQHQTGSFLGHAVTEIDVRDAAKNAWCIPRGITMIRLPHDWLDALKAATDQERLAMVRAELRAYGVTCRRSPGRLKLKPALGLEEAGMQRLEALAQKHGFKLLATRYIGAQFKYEFECPIHGPFSRVLSLFRHGCRQCGRAIGPRKRVARSEQRLIVLLGSDYSMLGEFTQVHAKVRCKCHKHDLVFDASPQVSFRSNRVVGCPACRTERWRAAKTTTPLKAARRLKAAA